MFHSDVAPKDFRFDPTGDCMQRAERCRVFKDGVLTQDYFVLRSSDGVYCGRDLVLVPERI
jgi:hypothetical protein